MFKSIFVTALTDVHAYPGKEELGVLRVEVDGKYGERWFRYVQNRTAGALAADSLVMYDGVLIGSAVAATNISSNLKVLRASGSFIDDKVNVDDIIHVVDDAGAAGAAPEGEYSFVTKVQALQVDFSPALTAALTTNDTVNFIKRWSVIAAAAAGAKRTAGIPMASLTAAFCGWIQVRGIYPSADVTAAGTAVAEGDRLRAGTAILEVLPTTAINANSGLDANEIAVAAALQSLASDTVRRKAVVLLQCE